MMGKAAGLLPTFAELRKRGPHTISKYVKAINQTIVMAQTSFPPFLHPHPNHFLVQIELWDLVSEGAAISPARPAVQKPKWYWGPDVTRQGGGRTLAVTGPA